MKKIPLALAASFFLAGCGGRAEVKAPASPLDTGTSTSRNPDRTTIDSTSASGKSAG